MVVCDGDVAVEGRPVGPGQFAYLGPSRDEIGIAAGVAARVMLLGGVPLDEALVMWWNYIARSREEIVQAHAEWTSGSERFGPVHSVLPRVVVSPPPWR